MEIFKLQKSLNVEGKILVYNKDKSFVKEDSVSPTQKQMFDVIFGDKLKIYVEGEVRHNDIYLFKLVEEQDW